MKKTVSVIIPVYNEEKNIKDAAKGALWAVKEADDYELIIVDDGSTDATGGITDTLKRKNPKIKVLHHKRNLGFGPTIKDGLKAASKEYVVGFPGDYDTSEESLKELIKRAGDKDVIMTYNANSGSRTWARRLFSKTFVTLMNLLFGLKLKYFNGSFICRTTLLKNLPLKSEGFAIYAEAKVRLLRKGASYEEIPFKHLGRKYGNSKAVSIRSILQTLRTIYSLLSTA